MPTRMRIPLLRKCRDDLMQYLFILNVIQNKHGLTDEEAVKIHHKLGIYDAK